MYPTPEVLAEIYRTRERRVEQLKALSSISSADLVGLDRLGRCRVANELWGRCLESARSELLNDSHHFVRSCALLANETRNN